MAVRVNAETFAAEVLQAEGLVLVDFYSDSCVPCKRIAPLLSEVAAADPDGLKVVKVNINFEQNWQNSMPYRQPRPLSFSRTVQKLPV